jgi:hypothetical protein
LQELTKDDVGNAEQGFVLNGKLFDPEGNGLRLARAYHDPEKIRD